MAGCFAEAGSELVGLLGVELLGVVAVLFLLLADGINLLLQGFVLDLSKGQLVIELNFRLPDRVLVVEVVI